MPKDNLHFGNVEHRDVHNVYGMLQVETSLNNSNVLLLKVILKEAKTRIDLLSSLEPFSLDLSVMVPSGRGNFKA